MEERVGERRQPRGKNVLARAGGFTIVVAMKPLARHMMRKSTFGSLTALLLLLLVGFTVMGEEPATSAGSGVPQPPPPLVPGAKVVALWPAGSPSLKGFDQKEELTFDRKRPDHVQRVVNIHNPSIELHLSPADKANGTAIVVAAGGGNKELWVGPEGVEAAEWLNQLGVSAFVLRYRLRPYSSAVDALADTQRSIRLIRANAKEWGVDPEKVGIMGFSAGGEQAARGGAKI